MLLVESLLVVHFRDGVAWREDLEDDGERKPTLVPLLVRTAVAFGPSEDDEDVWGDAQVGAAFDGVPEQVARDEDISAAPKQCGEVAEQHDDPAQLFRVVGRGLAVALWVDDEICGGTLLSS